jgi:hypothetical protein
MRRYTSAAVTRALAILLISGAIVLPARAICGNPQLLVNHDSSFEGGYTYDRCDEGQVGAFAEGFMGPGRVCAVQFYLCVMFWVDTREVHVYVWDSENGHPGTVLAMTITDAQHMSGCDNFNSPDEVEITAPVGREFFVGVQQCSWDWPMLIGADLDGPATGDQCWFYAPAGIGWGHVDDFWGGGVRAMSIGVYLESSPSPAEPSTWGTIKDLFRR